MLTCLKEKVSENYLIVKQILFGKKIKKRAIQCSSLSTETHSAFYFKQNKSWEFWQVDSNICTQPCVIYTQVTDACFY